MAAPEETIQLGPLEIRFLENRDSADGRLSLSSSSSRPAQVPALHYHERVDETAYGLDGTLTLTADGKHVDLGSAYFREIAAFIAAGDPPDPAKVAAVMARHGLVVVPRGV